MTQCTELGRRSRKQKWKNKPIIVLVVYCGGSGIERCDWFIVPSASVYDSDDPVSMDHRGAISGIVVN